MKTINNLKHKLKDFEKDVQHSYFTANIKISSKLAQNLKSPHYEVRSKCSLNLSLFTDSPSEFLETLECY